MQKKKGISLIVLVITIIVMIILAAAIILSLNNAGIINKANKAVQDTDLAQAKHLAALKWADAYLDDNITDKQGYVIDELAKQGITEEKYEITFTENGVDVELKDNVTQSGGGNTAAVPEEWKENVTAIIDTVPIPKGFVASPYDGEKTKDGGLVIYELANGETAIPSTETHQTSLTTRNQYVWVPVEDFSKFVRQSFSAEDTNDEVVILNVAASQETEGYWEVVVDTTTNLPLIEQDANYITSNTLEEVQAMYASVKEYKGFYIARYEAGIDNQRTEQGDAADLPRGTNVYSRMNKIPYTYIPWTWNDAMDEDANGAVEVARSIYPATNTNYGVASTLTYGVQWDATLQWWLDVNAKDIKGNEIDVNNSSAYGNYYSSIIEAGDLNEGAKYAYYDHGKDEAGEETTFLVGYENIPANTGKVAWHEWLLTTGALKSAKINNIYDMAGNMSEFTMEGSNYGYWEWIGGEDGDEVFVIRRARWARGGNFQSYSEEIVGIRAKNFADVDCSFRTSLYIKK